jgi:alkylated DNA repair dioxygenase AlkB
MLSRPLPGLLVFRGFASPAEQRAAVRLFDPVFRRMRRREGHFDGVITDYREFERDFREVPAMVPAAGQLRGGNDTTREGDRTDEDEISEGDDAEVTLALLKRIRDSVDAAHHKALDWKSVFHAVDISSRGEIGPHVDSIKFSAEVVASLSLLSTRVAEFKRDNGVSTPEAPDSVRVLLPPGSVFAVTGVSRYEYAHAILGGEIPHPEETGEVVKAKRRISVIQRDRIGELD